jgi:hypothetical protein
MSNGWLSGVGSAAWRCRAPAFTAAVVCLFLCVVAKADWKGAGWILARAASGPLSGALFANERLGAAELVGTAVGLIAMAAHPWRPGRIALAVSVSATAFWFLIGLASHM